MNEQDWGLNEGVMGVGGGGSNAPFTDEGWIDDMRHAEISGHVRDALAYGFLVRGLVTNTARSFSRETDKVIRAAINKRMGRDDWGLDELEGRLEIFTIQNKPGVEFYSLDGRPLITLHPLQSELVGNEILLQRQCCFHD